MISITKIKEDFDKVIRYSQGIENPKTDKLFDIWKTQKADIIDNFGGKLIHEYPEKVSFELINEAKKDRIDNFINYVWDIGYSELGNFLTEQQEGFFSNKVLYDYIIPNEKRTIIKKNTKLIKAFKYFVDNKIELDDLQSRASRIIQENKIEGTLCFSVHPLDYLSISENDNNWRSCHALNGEYRAGNLSYMMDNSTVICYLKSDKNIKLPNFPDDVLWNNKKWRVLLYLSEDRKMIFAGKQYPFTSDMGMEFIQKKCLNNVNNINSQKQYNDCFWGKWTNYKITELSDKGVYYSFNQAYIPMNNSLIPLSQLVIDKAGSKHFNDVLRSSCYDPIYTTLQIKPYRTDENQSLACEGRTHFKIGNMTYCLRCGEAEVYDSADTMMCYDCELNYGTSTNDCFGYCAKCGDRIDIENNAYWMGDDSYCQHCFDEYGARCVTCGSYELQDDMIYDYQKEEWFCKYCYEDLKERR